MLMVVAFSVGLALTLTPVGLAFLYARNRFKPRPDARWRHLLPIASAATITFIGAALCIGGLRNLS
jgi:ABC-type nickel/cobalt efflux system permease component RcnA